MLLELGDPDAKLSRALRAAGTTKKGPSIEGPLSFMRTPGVEPGPLAGQDPKFS